MAKYDMCEALYALPDGKIQPRRKPIAMPLMITLAGAAMVAVNIWVLAGYDMPNLKSALVLFGWVGIMVGGAMLASRLSGKSLAPYHKEDGCFLRREELKFNKDQKTTILELVGKGDFTTLRGVPSDGVSALVVEIYTSPRGKFTAAQTFESVDWEMVPVGEIKIVE